MPRIHCPLPLASHAVLELPAGAARHVQVLRLQPGDALTLFAGDGSGEFDAVVARMGRSSVSVTVGAHHAVDREAPLALHLAVGLMASDRMDWLVEKAVELGAASLQPLLTARSLLRLSGERADKKVAHWQAVAVAACEQCGRNRVPPVHAVRKFDDWLADAASSVQPGANAPLRLLLSLAADSKPMPAAAAGRTPLLFLSGPEGGLAPDEELAARAQGFVPVTLGPRTLRAETAPLAALAALNVAPKTQEPA